MTTHHRDDVPQTPARVAVIGYGSQGRAHALNLRDSGFDVAEGFSVFPDSSASVGSAALSPASDLLVLGDTAYGAGNRLAVASLSAGVLKPAEVIDVEDPFDLVFSPDGNQLLVVSGFGDAFFRLGRDPEALDGHFGTLTEIDYQGAAPELPGRAVLIEEGSQAGMVLVAENTGVRQVRFTGNRIEDLGLFKLTDEPVDPDDPPDLAGIVGSIGVQP